MPRNNPTYRWNANASRYVDSRGRFVSPDTVRKAIDATLDKNSDGMRALAIELRQGRIGLAEWRVEMKRAIKDAHLYSAMAARGGRAQMSQADYGRVGAEVRYQYARLEAFYVGIANGSVRLDGRFLTRVNLYAQSGRTTYERFRELEETENNGMEEYRNRLRVADHCTECVEITRKGWQPVGTLTPIGRRTCLSNCRCYWEYRAKPKRRQKRGPVPRIRETQPGSPDFPIYQPRNSRPTTIRPAATIEAPALKASRVELEERWRRNPGESGAAWKADGTLLLQKKGKKNNVPLYENEVAAVAGAELFTHNHPNGTPFSHDDISILRKLRWSRIRAVGFQESTGRDVDYELSRNTSELDPAKDALFFGELKKVYSNKELMAELERRVPFKNSTDSAARTLLTRERARVWDEIMHERLAEFFKRHSGFTYTRTYPNA